VSRLDLSAAFNTTDHDRDILITRLSFCFSTMALFSAGSSHICHLVASLSNMKITCLPGTHPHAVSPKALFLVLLFIVMCTTPLSTLISSCSLNHHLYADYTQLFLSFHPIDFDASKDHLQNALNRISSWMTANLLTLSSSKTEFLFTGLSNQLANIHNHSNPTVSALVKNIRAHRIQAHLTCLQSFHNHPTFISA